MNSKRIEDFANTISFNIKEDSAYGYINNFMFSVYETGNKKCFFVYFLLDDISANDENPVSIMTLSNSMQDIFSKYGITDYSFKDDGLEVSCSISFKGFYSLMKETAKKLSEFEAVRKNICFSCKTPIAQGEKIFRFSQNSMNRLLCETCCKEMTSEQESLDTEDEESEAVTSSNNRSMLKGICGALLFGLGVSICLVLLYAFVLPLPDPASGFKPGYYVSWISAFIPIAAFFGYRIFSKDSINTKIILITGGISLAFSLIAQYISSLVLFSRESILIFEDITMEKFAKMIPSLLKIPFTDSFVSPDFKIYVLMDAIFVVLALIIICFFLRRKAESEIIIEEL